MRLIHTISSVFLLALLLGPSAWASEKGLVAAWDFEESGAAVKDSSASHCDGAIVGDVRRVKGVDGNGLEFTGGNDDYVVVKSKAALDLQDKLTITAWVCRTDTGSRWDAIISNGDPNKGYLVFYSEKDQTLTLYLNTDAQGFGSVVGAYMPVDEWMHIAVTFDSEAGKIALYQDGVKTAERAYKGRITGIPSEFYLGKSQGYQAFRGKLDRVRLYDRVLSSDEIATGYRAIADTLPPPAQPLPVLFENLKAEIIGKNRTRFTFEKTDGFAKTPESRRNELTCTVVRTQHPRNDVSPGARSTGKRITVTLSSKDGKHYEFVDRVKLAPGVSYFYRVSAAPNPPDVFRVNPAKFRNYHPEIWWSVKRINDRIDAIAAAYPALVQIKEIGRTVNGRPMRALYAGKGPKWIVMLGSMHVAESGPELNLPAVEGILREHPELLNTIGVVVLPCINLDERERMLSTGYPLYQRKNANGVDLNRNFPGYWEPAVKDPNVETYQGPHPASEPEVRAVMSLVEQTKPEAIFSFHSIASLCNADFLYTRFAEKDGDTPFVVRCKAITNAYADGMYGSDRDKYYTVEPSNVAGNLSSWAYRAHGIPCFDVELDRNPGPRKVVYGDAVPVSMLREFQVRHQHGIENLITTLSAMPE